MTVPCWKERNIRKLVAHVRKVSAYQKHFPYHCEGRYFTQHTHLEQNLRSEILLTWQIVNDQEKLKSLLKSHRLYRNTDTLGKIKIRFLTAI